MRSCRACIVWRRSSSGGSWGTHQGAVRPLHLDYFLDEFTFRFNRRTSRARGKLFYRLVQRAVEVDPVYWRDVAAAARAHNHNL